jgi:hypothetical protein
VCLSFLVLLVVLFLAVIGLVAVVTLLNKLIKLYLSVCSSIFTSLFLLFRRLAAIYDLTNLISASCISLFYFMSEVENQTYSVTNIRMYRLNVKNGPPINKIIYRRVKIHEAA